MIERAFGVLKRRFKVLQMRTHADQTKLIYCCFAIHNYIRMHDRSADAEIEREVRADQLKALKNMQQVIIDEVAVDSKEVKAHTRRELIATLCWAQYTHHSAQEELLQ